MTLLRGRWLSEAVTQDTQIATEAEENYHHSKKTGRVCYQILLNPFTEYYRLC